VTAKSPRKKNAGAPDWERRRLCVGGGERSGLGQLSLFPALYPISQSLNEGHAVEQLNSMGQVWLDKGSPDRVVASR
jgi:hypothetical protein